MSRKRTKNFKLFKERINSNKAEKYLDIRETGLCLKLEKNEKFKQYPENWHYWVSNYGKVICKNKSDKYKIIKVTTDVGGKRAKVYQRVWIDNCEEYLHRVVAKTWCKGYTEISNEVHHIDGDGLNNYYKNLKWVCKPYHNLLDRGAQLFFMSNREKSDFKEVDDFEAVAQKLGLDVRVLGYILSSTPDATYGNLDIYQFDTGGAYPYVIGVKRKQNVKSVA